MGVSREHPKVPDRPLTGVTSEDPYAAQQGVSLSYVLPPTGKTQGIKRDAHHSPQKDAPTSPVSVHDGVPLLAVKGSFQILR